ncbi:hypothetical protein CTZ27_05560 [Streptomyces griseocarneus]|nr:hypothetical protein CTZ27_05560 [Streptomyces griseocarneus]
MAAIVVAAVLVAGIVVGGLVLAFKNPSHKSSAGKAPSPSASSEQSAPATEPGDEPSATPSEADDSGLDQRVPYVVLKPGECFDHPSLHSGISVVTKQSCSGTHDGEVISNATLSGSFDTEQAIQDKAKSLCEADAQKRVSSITDGRTYYSYVLYPAKRTYDRGQNQITCSITRSITPGGAKLTEPLPN